MILLFHYKILMYYKNEAVSIKNYETYNRGERKLFFASNKKCGTNYT